jgi:hypothetical protein
MEVQPHPQPRYPSKSARVQGVVGALQVSYAWCKGAKFVDVRPPMIKKQRSTRLRAAIVEGSCFAASFRNLEADAVVAWCMLFWFQIVKLTGSFEGNIIRCMRRLEELLRQVGFTQRAAIPA